MQVTRKSKPKARTAPKAKARNPQARIVGSAAYLVAALYAERASLGPESRDSLEILRDDLAAAGHLDPELMESVAAWCALSARRRGTKQ